MKNGKLKRFTHRALSMLLAVLTVLPSGLLTMPARAAEIQTTQTKLVVWDWITDMQSIGKGADYDPNTDPFVDGHAAIPVKDTKYTRIMFYQSTGGDRYYFNGGPEGGNKPGYYSNYDENKIYLDSDSRIGNSSHKEWNQDLTDFEHFVTLGGQRTPYIQYAEEKKGYHSWRFWCANKDDSLSDYTLMLVDDYEDLDLRRTYGGFSDPHIYYGAKNDRFRSDGWIIDKHFVGAAAANYEYTHDNFVIWHWDNDSGGYNETLDFDVGDRKFKSFNAGTKAGVEEFKIYLGKEYSVGTLAENYTVPSDQSQTLGRPLYYIPKGKVLTVAKDAVLTIDGVLLNDGEIVVKDGGLLVVKDGAKIMPLTKYDNNCGMITSQGNIVVGDDALLCGGGVNGIRILGGGVVNFGVMAAESFYVSENYAIDNRETGWVLAGKSPSRESRIRYITDAIANEGATKPTDVNKDFAKIANFDSSYNIPVNGIYGNTANVSKSGEKAVGSPDDPTLTVYVKSAPGDQKDEVLFKDVKLDKVSLRVDGDTATYTADGKTYTIQNKLVSATIGRGGNGSEVVFQNMWVGSLDKGYLQFEPLCAPGYRLALAGGSTNNGTNVIIQEADNGLDKFWRLTSAGLSGTEQTYYIDSVKYTGGSRGLDLPGIDTARDGMSVDLYDHDGGKDQRWIMHPSLADGTYYFDDTMLVGVCLAVKDGKSGNGTDVVVERASLGKLSQTWRVANLLSEDTYSEDLLRSSALDFIPQNATDKRLSLSTSGTPSGQNAVIRAADANGDKQRWRLEAVGSENLDGAATVFYRIVEMTTGLVLETKDATVKSGTNVITSDTAGGDRGKQQYWYLKETGGSDCYYVAARSSSNMVLTAGSSDNAALTLSDNTKAENQIWKISGVSSVAEQAERAAEDAKNDVFAGKAYEMSPTDLSSRRLMGDTGKIGQPEGLTLEKSVSNPWNSKWQLRRAGTDNTGPYYQIVVSEGTGDAAIGVRDSDKAEDKADLVLKSSNVSDEKQLWRVTENSDGTYTFSARSNGNLVLGTKEGTTVSQYQHGVTYSYGLALVGVDKGSKVGDDGWTTYEYTKSKWKLTESVYAPLDGMTLLIAPKYADGMRVGVPDGSDNNNVSVTLKTASSSLYQRWTFAKAGVAQLDGVDTAYYTVKNMGSGKMLAITSGKAKSGANVIQWQLDDNQDKFWFVTTEADGYCTLVPYLDQKLRLDASGSGKTDGTNVQLYTKNGNDNQKWKLTDASTIDFLDGNVFYLSPKHTGTDMVLDLCGNGTANETKVQIYEKKETEIQRWKFEKVGTDYLSGKKCNYYTIKSVYATGKALDNSGSTANGAWPHLWDYNASNKNQQWYVTDAGGGYYYIVPREDTTKYLGVQSANTGNNSVVELWDSNGDNRKWKLTETIAPTELGTYELESVGGTGFTIDVTDNSDDSGKALVLYAAHAKDYTRWHFEKMGTDSKGAYYRIINKASGRAMDIQGVNDTKADKALLQATYDFYDDQLWYLNKAGSDDRGDFYYIENRHNSKLRIGVQDAKYQNNQALVLTTGTGDNTKWRLNEDFTPVDLGTYEFGMNDSAYSYLRMVVQSGSADNGNSIVVYSRHTSNPNAGAKLVQFKIIQRGTDIVDGVSTPYYSIQNTSSGKVLDPIGAASVSDGTNVQQYSYDGYSDQHWYMEVRGDNSVVFRNRCNSNLVLTAEGTNDSSNIALKTYDEKNLSRQSWQLHPIMQTNAAGQYYIPGNKAAADAGIPFMSAEDTILNPEVGGKYNLIPQHSSTLRMDLSGGSTDNGTKIQIYTNAGNAYQKWQFIPMGVDYFDGGGKIFYKIAFGSNANKVAQSAGISTVKASQDISIYDDEGCYDDQWYLEQAGERTEDGETFYNYYIVGRGTMSSTSKICIAVPGGATGNGTQLQTATVRSGSSYKYLRWELLPTD